MSDILSHLKNDLIQPYEIASGKIFLSYSRKNRDFAKALYAKLQGMGFSLWRDVHDIDAGADDWWQSIQEAIRECETVILCMSLPALKSPVVGDEWFYARTLGKRIIPIVADDIWGHEEVTSGAFTIPNWMSRKNWMDFRHDMPEADSAWANFIRTMNETYDPKRFINMVGELPPRFVRRPEELDNTVRSLVDDNNDAVAMTTALKGAGGYGKTTLAKAVARDVRIQGAFDDGILWVTLGEELLQRKGDELKNALVGRVLELINALTGERPVIESLDMARAKLSEAIGDLYILLVVDDVWDEMHLKPFLAKNKHNACLITTRNSDAIKDDSIAKQPIDKMKLIEAVELLGAGIDPDAVKSQTIQLRHLARELREYPLVLALANTQIANLMTDMGLSLPEALSLAQETLSEQGVLGFDDTSPEERTRAVSATLDVSISQLKPDQQRMYKELAIFPEDALIPLTTLEKYWGMSKIATLQFCQLLYRKTALLHSFEGMAIRIHDVFRNYLIRQWTRDQFRDLHQRLITNYGDLHTLPDNYSWRNITYHLIGAGQKTILRGLLINYAWIDKKLHATDANALIDDYGVLLAHGKDETIRLIQSAVNMSANVLDKDKRALAHQLAGRLMHHYKTVDEIRALLDVVMTTPNNLFPAFPDSDYDIMNPAGGTLLRTMKHDEAVNGAMQLHDGRILSWSGDTTLRVWDADGTPIITLTGHMGMVLGAIELSDNSILSWSNDETLRLWSGDGRQLAVLAGHTNWINGATQLADGRILSWSDDATLRLWARDGMLLTTLIGHTREVTGALELADGRILSWSIYDTLRLWARDGTALITLMSHTGHENDATQLADGRILSWGDGATLRLWAKDGTALTTLVGHTREVIGALELTDGRILSWSDDRTLRLWARDGMALMTLTGHTGRVNGATQLADGRILSWSYDDTLRLWARDGTALTTLIGHTQFVTGSLELTDGRILSWAHNKYSKSKDKTLHMWARDGTALMILTGHTNWVNGATQLADGRILSWSDDATLRIWARDGTALTTLTEHTAWVNGATQLADGRVLSWSDDATLRLWARDGTALMTLTGHTGRVNGATQLADGRILSWSDDATLRIWASDGTLLTTFIGHTREVTGALELADGRILSWSYVTLRLWAIDGTPIDELVQRYYRGDLQAIATWAQGHDLILDDIYPSERKTLYPLMKGGMVESHLHSTDLIVYDPQTNITITFFYGDARFSRPAVLDGGDVLVVGDSVGRVLFLRWVGEDDV
ncbi:MAG: TIR domain-containing protein [bacterium]|nr:TIR domain-containing protein [bacterium]